MAGSARSDWLTLEFSGDSPTMIVWSMMVNLFLLDRHSPFSMLTASLTLSLSLQSLASNFRRIFHGTVLQFSSNQDVGLSLCSSNQGLG